MIKDLNDLIKKIKKIVPSGLDGTRLPLIRCDTDSGIENDESIDTYKEISEISLVLWDTKNKNIYLYITKHNIPPIESYPPEVTMAILIQ